MLSVATHKSAAPYLAVTAGPASHSPPPIAAAPMTRPGPIIIHRFLSRKWGASASSPTFHRGMAWLPGQGACEGSAVGGVGIRKRPQLGRREEWKWKNRSTVEILTCYCPNRNRL